MFVCNICDLTPFTMQDFGDKLACIIWFSGCNMLCQYCHNLDLVFEQERAIPIKDILDFLRSRIGKLEGVVLCGGEPTLYPDLLYLVHKIKALGFAIKLDTNGLNTRTIEVILPYLDFVALDFKAPEDKFKSITKSNKFEKFAQTFELLIHSKCSFEVRTTYHSALLGYTDIQRMTEWLVHNGYKKEYYIQNYTEQKTYIKKLPPSEPFDLKKLATKGLQIVVR